MDRLLHDKLDLIARALNAYVIEEVATVIRRTYTRSDGVDAELVDLYPPWNDAGTFGAYKVASEYMDYDWQRKRFEKHSGLTLVNLPVLEAQVAPRRTYGRALKHEVAVARPFRLMLLPRPGEEGGTAEKTPILHYLASDRPVPAQQTPPPAPQLAPAPAPRQSGDVPAKDWELEAAQSTDPLMFDTAMVKVQPWFKTATVMAQFREVIWPDFEPNHAPGYVAGLKTYAEARKAGKNHQQGKAAAYDAFRKAMPADAV